MHVWNFERASISLELSINQLSLMFRNIFGFYVKKTVLY